MAPPDARKNFVQTLREVAEKHGLDFSSFSHDWILQLRDKATGQQCSVFGYTFDSNPAAAVEICKEKAATSLVLNGSGVANVPHHVFLSPSNPFTAKYVSKNGIWEPVQEVVKKYGFPVVVKPLKGTGGLDVMKATCWREVEAAVQHIFSREYGLAVCPYKHVVDEYRCICVGTEVQLTYRKVRSSVLGDGERSVGALLAERLQNAKPEEMAALLADAAELRPEELGSVPAKGQDAALQWKHNLGHGASVDLKVEAEMAKNLAEVAVRAVKAIGMSFCSVDIIDVKDEGLLIMEVNGGVMMDSLMSQLGESGKALAFGLYEKAVLKALGRSVPA
ncbi:unnamed protein product [Durusdinium trenchii]|uniref:ATP-grasp domain-containing protein n=1 Tax=Durusdinium trenchii TaxID=1381693 RepID=A0ABP0R3E2_9DINO